jgi:hypothetical protein
VGRAMALQWGKDDQRRLLVQAGVSGVRQVSVQPRMCRRLVQSWGSVNQDVRDGPGGQFPRASATNRPADRGADSNDPSAAWRMRSAPTILRDSCTTRTSRRAGGPSRTARG